MGRKVARRRRKAYIEALIHNAKQEIEKQRERKENKKDREFIMDKLCTMQLEQQVSSTKKTGQNKEAQQEAGKKIHKLSKLIVKKQRTKDKRRREKIKNRIHQAAAMLSG